MNEFSEATTGFYPTKRGWIEIIVSGQPDKECQGEEGRHVGLTAQCGNQAGNADEQFRQTDHAGKEQTRIPQPTAEIDVEIQSHLVSEHRQGHGLGHGGQDEDPAQAVGSNHSDVWLRHIHVYGLWVNVMIISSASFFMSRVAGDSTFTLKSVILLAILSIFVLSLIVSYSFIRR